MEPLVLLVAIGAVLGFEKNHRRWALLFAFAVAMWSEVALTVGAGWAIGELGRVNTKRRLFRLPYALGVVALSVL